MKTFSSWMLTIEERSLQVLYLTQVWKLLIYQILFPGLSGLFSLQNLPEVNLSAHDRKENDNSDKSDESSASGNSSATVVPRRALRWWLCLAGTVAGDRFYNVQELLFHVVIVFSKGIMSNVW